MEIACREEQPAKAVTPIVVMLLGMSMEFSEVQLKNAQAPILVMPLSKTTDKIDSL